MASLDLGSLGVTFGGFSPTAMDGVETSRRYIEVVQALEAERKETRRRLRELEFARTSKPAVYEDAAGTRWTYVVVDKSLVRIVSCESSVEILEIPSEIEGVPVYEIAADACSRNDCFREIICPDSIESIGSCAFRYCPNLQRIVFPKLVNEFSASWLSHCPNVEEMVLPDYLEVLDSAIFDSPSLKKLSIGSRARVVEAGAFQKTKLEQVSISPDNPFLSTDGTGIYSIDGLRLHALARPVERYSVQPGCEIVGKKAFYNIDVLEWVTLPSTVRVLEDYAFSHSGITRFEAPASLASIGERAFLYCANLREAILNEGLEVVGNSAFAESDLRALRYPASIGSIGRSVTHHTRIVHSGPGCSLQIDEGCSSLFLDGQGGLYRREEDGSHFIQLIDLDLEEFAVQEGTVIIGEYAFAHNGRVRHVSLPDGLEEIGARAFRNCAHLETVDVPDTVTSIGEEAFIDTGLTSFRIPLNLEHLGPNALVTSGAHHGDQRPSLAHIKVAPGNDRFYMARGMLCRRMGDKSNVVLFTSDEPNVVFPPEIDTIESYAFNNARGIRYLELNPGLRLIETLGLTTWCWIEHIHIELSSPVEGRSSYDFHFPNTMKGIHGISMGIGGASWVNVAGIMAQYDNALVHAHDYNSPRNPDSIPIYDQVKGVVARLEDPVLLVPVNRNMYDRLLRIYIVEICVDIARHDDRVLMSKLIELGYVNGDNLEEIIAAVGRLQDAAMTSYLLEVKRLRFNKRVIDFDL